MILLFENLVKIEIEIESCPYRIDIYDDDYNKNLVSGESEPKWRSSHFTHDNALLTDNLIFYSTYCVEGWAKVQWDP